MTTQATDAKQLTVLYVKKTGHILGAITRAANPATELDASAMAGAVFPHRQNKLSFAIPAEHLATWVTELKLGVLRKPSDHVVKLDKDGNPTGLAPAETSPAVSIDALSSSQVSLKRLMQLQEERPVVAVVSPTDTGLGVRVGDGMFAWPGGVGVQDDAIAVPYSSLPTGTSCDLLVLVAGFAPQTATKTVP